MSNLIEEIYNDLTVEKDYILSGKAKRMLDAITQKWNELTENLPNEEKKEFEVLHALTDELINICSLDHFAKGFKMGAMIATDVTDRINLTLR